MNEIKHRGRRVMKEIRINATPEEVWDAWALPEQISQWFVDRASGEARAGGVMKWGWDSYGGGADIPLPVLEAKRPERLVLSGGDVPDRPTFIQEVVVEPDSPEPRRRGGGAPRHEPNAGVTRLLIVNSGFGEGADWDDEYEGVDSGWTLALATLKAWLEGHRHEKRGHVMVMREARVDYEKVLPLYTTAEGLKKWLAQWVELSHDPMVDGVDVRAQLKDGSYLTGRVLARSRREILLSWTERRGVLALKVFEKPYPSRMIALDFNAWPLPDSPEPIGRGGSPELNSDGGGAPSLEGDDAPRHEPDERAKVNRFLNESLERLHAAF